MTQLCLHRIGRSLVHLLLPIVVASGCASRARPLSADPQDILLGRYRFDTPTAYIYASSPAAAAEADRDLQVVTADLPKAAHLAPVKGLVIVSDAQDAPYATDLMLVTRLIQQEEAARGLRPPATQPITQEKLDKAAEKIGPELLRRIFLARCGSIEPAEAVALFHLQARPAASAAWVITAPTSAYVQQVANEILDKATSQKETGLMGKAILAPLRPFLAAKARQQTPINRQVAFYAAMVQHDPRLVPAERTRLISTYCQRKQRQAKQQDNEGLTLLEQAQRNAAATQPNETTP